METYDLYKKVSMKLHLSPQLKHNPQWGMVHMNLPPIWLGKVVQLAMTQNTLGTT